MAVRRERESERGAERRGERVKWGGGERTRFIGFSKYPCTQRVEPDASISVLENLLSLSLLLPVSFLFSLFRFFFRFPVLPLYPVAFFVLFRPFSIGFDAFERESILESLSITMMLPRYIQRLRSIYSYGRTTVLKEKWKRGGELTRAVLVDHGTRGGRKWRDFGGWLKTREKGKNDRFAPLLSSFRRTAGRVVCSQGEGGKLSPMGFLPAIPRRIVFFSVFCCGLLSASARSLSPRRRIVSPSLDTFVHRFDMFDAERANEKHRRSEIGRDFPSEAQHCCYESKSRFVSCMNRWFDFSCQDIFFFSLMLKDWSVILIHLERDRVLTRFDVPFINEILF